MNAVQKKKYKYKNIRFNVFLISKVKRFTVSTGIKTLIMRFLFCFFFTVTRRFYDKRTVERKPQECSWRQTSRSGKRSSVVIASNIMLGLENYNLSRLRVSRNMKRTAAREGRFNQCIKVSSIRHLHTCQCWQHLFNWNTYYYIQIKCTNICIYILWEITLQHTTKKESKVNFRKKNMTKDVIYQHYVKQIIVMYQAMRTDYISFQWFA